MRSNTVSTLSYEPRHDHDHEEAPAPVGAPQVGNRRQRRADAAFRRKQVRSMVRQIQAKVNEAKKKVQAAPTPAEDTLSFEQAVAQSRAPQGPGTVPSE